MNGLWCATATIPSVTFDRRGVVIGVLALDYGGKDPKAVAKIVGDMDVPLEFYQYPARHWVHAHHDRIESVFSSVRLRTVVTRGPAFRVTGLSLAYKIIGSEGRAVV